MNIFYSPSIAIATTPLQRVEIQMSSDTPGAAAVFWAPGQSGIYIGFEPGDQYNFQMAGDGAFHQYVLPIDTSSAATIYRLRLEVPAGATVAIKSVALTSLSEPAGPGVIPSWQFAGGTDAQGWILYEGVADMAVSGGRLQIQTYANSTILAPQAQVTNKLEWFTLSGQVTQSSLSSPWIQFSWLSSVNGTTRYYAYIPVVADSADHVYNQDVGGGNGWWATVSGLAVSIPENTTIGIGSIQISAAPQGPSDVALDACGPGTLVHAGLPFPFSCRVADRGSQTVQQLSVNLTLPPDGSVKVVSAPTVPSSVAYGYPQTLTWTLLASNSGSAPISVSASVAGRAAAVASAAALVNPPISAAPSPYVPLPQPVSSAYDIGMYYFPGWGSSAHWEPIRGFSERTPALGYYDETQPEVVDWEIKWAVEHGIKFFGVEWYWADGEMPNDFLQAYFASAYHEYVNFCIVSPFDNTNATPKSMPEFLSVAQTWISKYFGRPEYYQINGMPVVIVLNPQSLDTNLGGLATQALEGARQLARSAGYKGIYFIGGGSQPSQLVADGYDAFSAYSYPFAGATDPDQAPYSLAVTGYESIWDSLAGASSIPYIIPTGPGWDHRPWNAILPNQSSLLVRTGSTPELFQQMLQAAKDRIDAGKAPPVVMVEAWNEFGEGAYVAPTAGRGFGYLDAIRNVFADTAPHTDLTPADVGLPLVEAAPGTTLWTFTDPSDLIPWQPSSGGPFYDYASGISNSRVINNQWTFTASGSPALSRQSFALSAADYSGIAVRMVVSADTYVILYWGAQDAPGPSAFRSAGFTAKAGPIQTYTVPLAGNAGWRGVMNSLRITMSNPTPNINVAIESIQFIPSAGTQSIAVSRSQVLFTSMPGSSAPQPQVVSIAGSNSNLSWTASPSMPWVVLSAANGNAPANITVSVNPAGLAVGVHKGTITVAVAGAGNSSLTVPVTFWMLPAAASPPPPSISSVVNGADFKVEALSPGAWISILGQNLGNTASATAANALAVGGASISICGIPAVVSYNSGPVTTGGSTSWQVNTLVPDGVAGRTSCPVVASVGARASQPASVIIASGIMELFQFNASTGTLPIVTHADYSLVGPVAAGFTPAKPNETLIAWGTGDCSNPSVTVGGRAATVAFAGRVSPGLCQINFAVPSAIQGSVELKLSTSLNSYSLWVSP